MKPTLNEEIGMSQEGIEYVNSLEVKEPTIVNVIDAAMDQIKKHGYSPRYVKYFDGEKWVEAYSEELVIPKTTTKYTRTTLNYETAMRAIKNNIQEEIEKQRIKKEARNNLIFVAIVLIIVLIVNWK